MKTHISSFCDEYKLLLAPMDDTIAAAVGRVEGESREDLLQRPLSQLADARHRFGSLLEKIEHQQAYLIIFGPLKSGKSTLMNAISGTYVSEVSSMPAYPCLVYVSHGEEAGFSAISYNGASHQFDGAEGLKEVLDESHSHLADRIRMHELEGEEFDPKIHYTEAVRRIDVKVPVPALREANTVLVDTPGLYSRMKFGYDLMTREFRNSAACAVFVVKSDNLFLDQVFAEFSELLKSFSRIFLVVNVDTGKRDLQPDGSLAPSIESSDPAQIVEAFKSLSMSAPLREALEAGRLQIYPIDLLNAAAGKLGNEKGEGALETSFDAFLSDLTDYLNSSDYLREFERDSLKQGDGICDQIRTACDIASVDAFEREQSDLERIKGELEALIAAVDEVTSSDMDQVFEGSRGRCLEAAETAADGASAALRSQLGEMLNKWMDNGESLQTLIHRLNSAISKASEPIASGLPRSLVSQFDTETGGADFDTSLTQQLRKGDLDFKECAKPFLQKLRDLPDPAWKNLELETDQIKVRRTLGDWILFRRSATVRERFFGRADAPNQPVDPALKRKALAGRGLGQLESAIDTYLEMNFPAPQREYVEKNADEYIKKFTEDLMKRVGSIRSEAADHLESTEARIAGDKRILEAVERLDDEIAALQKRIHLMGATYLAESDDATVAPSGVEAVENSDGARSEREPGEREVAESPSATDPSKVWEELAANVKA